MLDVCSFLLKSSSYIDGQWFDNTDKLAVVNPATGQPFHYVSNMTTGDAIKAVESAHRTFRDWSHQTAAYRAKVLKTWLDLIIKHKDALAYIITLEQGKPLAEARAEIEYGAAFIEWFAEEAKRVYGDTIPAASQSQKIIVTKQPVGVVTAITPWNFPHAMITRKAAAALAAGCTFVVKPAHQTPLSALALAELADQANIPAGVFNVIVSDKSIEIGQVLTQHSGVNKFTFTGSTSVGKQLIAQCAQGVKKVSMELGGNAPFIVFADADIDLAIKGYLLAKFRNAGQTCICANRLLLADSIHDEFIDKLHTEMAKIQLGDGTQTTTNMGPLISVSAVERVNELVNTSIKLGAKQVKLNIAKPNPTPNSRYYPPTLLTQVNEDMPVVQQEIFGPVVAALRFKSEDEAIKMANNTEYGLAAYFYTRDISRVWRVSSALNFGMVGINDAAISNPAAPFGGINASGNGREGSKYGLDDYLEIKYLSMGGLI
ncbi:NAD-dependent succinate-semialdehyde dehydrogenase [Algibacillus agarilyticus]|uniref:NAD-dependent succinate-semialdehyde dehydrogenase n=1 Tax=Algibacillus agarilyticus TaxID=2234133 RepID=UPI000DD0AD46|nr:NAD-dependent succinate-semialdehyde dehydrogenase [Algibacillus agarilyticus]